MSGAAGYGELLDALRGVTWPARRAARGSTSGTHRSRLRGVSPEFTEYRPYRQGDDPRRLDWRLLARTNRAYLRITSDRATLSTLVLVDASASMAYPEKSLAKWNHARRLAIGLTGIAHASGDPVAVGVVTAHGTIRTAPRTRRGVVTECARVLDAASPQGRVDLGEAMHSAHSARRLVVISDFLSDASALLKPARALLGEGGEVIALHVVAREELSPEAGAILATDPEEAEIKRALTPETAAAYARAFAEWRDWLAREWRAAGAQYEMTVSEEPADRVVRRIARGEREGEREP
ncbi:MAG TPA: DUF58 domain-containing protein [Gemmatimonadaceae bacterium]|nr:DUF58 domain-containing protein [Gemmatimonadaceae bacterium]